MNTRLENIKQRAEALGFDFWHTANIDGQKGFCVIIRNDPVAAERLLAMYEPGPVVDSEELDCYDCGVGSHYCEVPGPGKYKLVRVVE